MPSACLRSRRRSANRRTISAWRVFLFFFAIPAPLVKIAEERVLEPLTVESLEHAYSDGRVRTCADLPGGDGRELVVASRVAGSQGADLQRVPHRVQAAFHGWPRFIPRSPRREVITIKESGNGPRLVHLPRRQGTRPLQCVGLGSTSLARTDRTPYLNSAG